MTASYPGAVKAFTSKIDTVDTVWAEHVNSLQDEVTAIESVIGPNPQGAHTTINARLVAIEGNLLGEVIPDRRTFTGDRITINNQFRALSPAIVDTIATVTNPFQIGPSGAQNLAMDGKRIQARTNNAPSDLLLQPLGGDAYVGNGKVWTNANDGSGSGLDADTVDGKHAADFSVAVHSHVKDILEVRGTSQLAGSYGYRNWYNAIFDTVVTQTTNQLTYDSLTGEFIIPRSAGIGVYVLSCSFAVRSFHTHYHWWFWHWFTGGYGPNFSIRILDNAGRVLDREDFTHGKGHDHGYSDDLDEFYGASLVLNGTYMINPLDAPGNADYRIKFQFTHNSDHPSLCFGPHSSQRPMNASGFLLSKA